MKSYLEEHFFCKLYSRPEWEMAGANTVVCKYN
jgi:hypothetical protein